MATVSVSIPDDIVTAAKAAGIAISGLATATLRAELDRRAKIAQLDAHLAALEVKLGPIPTAELDQARRWAKRFDGDAGDVPVRVIPA